jgi:hypothetical protein
MDPCSMNIRAKSVGDRADRDRRGNERICRPLAASSNRQGQASMQAVRRALGDLLTSSASERATSAARGMALAAHLFPTWR